MMDMGRLLKEKDYFGYGIETAYTKPNTEKKKRAKSVGIKDDELVMMYNDLKASFYGKRFANKDLKELCLKWGLTNRQTPSRLKKLSDQGLLERFETSPLSYELK